MENDMQSSHTTLATAVLFVLGTVAVSAQQTPTAPAAPPASIASAAGVESSGLPAFDELDKTHQGYLNRRDIPKDVEGLSSLRAHFIEYDKDQNGRLSPDEYAAYAASQSGGHHPT